MKKSFLGGANEILKYLAAAAVIVFIAYLFPNHVHFKYNFQKAQKWSYTDLVAPFDFPIYKDKETYEAQINEAVSKVPPVYKIDDQIASSNALAIANRVVSEHKAYDSNSTLKAERIQSSLMRVFQQGIRDSIAQPKLNLIVGNTTKIIKTTDFYTTTAAVEEIEHLLVNQGINLPKPFYSGISKVIKPNLIFDKTLTESFRNAAKEEIPRSNGVIKKGRIIIGSGEIINDEKYNTLSSFRQAFNETITQSRSKWVIFSGYLLLTCLIIGVLFIYLYFYFPKVFESTRKTIFILIWPAVFTYLVYAIENNTALSTYLIPFCIVPIIIKNFYNERLALFVHIVVVLIASFISKLGYEFTFLQILAGIVTILVVSETRYWNKFFAALGILLLTYALGYLGLSLISEGDLAGINLKIFGWLALNVVFTLLAYPFIPLLEKVFGFTSSITLAELSDMNRPLLKDMSIKAPGTMQHSLQVANLSEAAADKIGADSLLVKVAALYHDIGKMDEPLIFIENQGDYPNPHDNLTNFESASKIIYHVTEGEKKAIKAGLPKIIIDFIKTHHGTTRVEYFYRNQLQDFPDQEFDETLFRYPGPKPTTKEQTILMLADSIEAASKSLKSPTGADIDELCDKILAGKIANDQLTESQLSFKDLEICMDTFKSLLRSIHHVRVEYPPEVTPSQNG